MLIVSPGDDDTAAVNSGPFLKEEIMSLKGLELIMEHQEPSQAQAPTPDPVTQAPTPVVEEKKPADKKAVKPKWLKL